MEDQAAQVILFQIAQNDRIFEECRLESGCPAYSRMDDDLKASFVRLMKVRSDLFASSVGRTQKLLPAPSGTRCHLVVARRSVALGIRRTSRAGATIRSLSVQS
jgi:hypothetical protein